MTNLYRWLERTLRIIVRSRFTPEFRSLINRILSAGIILSTITAAEGTALWYVSNETVSSPFSGMYVIILSVFGETKELHSLAGKIILLIALAQGLILATYLIAVAAFFTIRGGRIMTRRHDAHIVICGWNFQGVRIIEELMNARNTMSFEIVVIPGDPIPEELQKLGGKVFLIPGSPTDDQALEEAGINTAKSAIILTDPSLSPENADAKVLMITLAVETMNPEVHTCAQIMNSENAIHLKRANVDEIVRFDVIGANLSVASALNPGVTRMVSELVHFDEGSEFYKMPLPPIDIVGKTFASAVAWFSSRDIILVGVESEELKDSYQTRDSSGKQVKPAKVGRRGVHVNPKGYLIQEKDALYVIADDIPEL